MHDISYDAALHKAPVESELAILVYNKVLSVVFKMDHSARAKNVSVVIAPATYKEWEN